MTGTPSHTSPQADDVDRCARLICFDLGGVLVRICWSWEEACLAAGLPVRPLPVDGELQMNEIHRLVHQYQVGSFVGDEFAKRYSALVDGAYSADEVLAVHRAWLLGEYDGVVDLIDAIHASGIDTAALSNTNEAHWRAMADFPAMRRLRRPLGSHLLKLAKPDPAIYRAAEKLLGTSGKQIIFFDDLEDNVAVARDTGWNAYRIDPHGCPATQMFERLRTLGIL